MVALVGSEEDALRNSTSCSEEWTQVTARKFITGKQTWKPKKKGISNSRVNQNAMRVYIETTAKDNVPSETEVNVPHKPRKVEAFKKETRVHRKKTFKDQTSASFSYSKFKKFLIKELQRCLIIINHIRDPMLLNPLKGSRKLT
jgi:hypothetical protein